MEKEKINFKGMVLEEIDIEDFQEGEDVFKLVRWKKKERPFEWYFKLIKPVKTFKEKYKK